MKYRRRPYTPGGERQLYESLPVPRENKCASCHAKVLWLHNVHTGKPAPIDALPTAGGNIRLLENDAYATLGRGDAEAARQAGEPLHMSHFKTCPSAALYRNRGSQWR